MLAILVCDIQQRLMYTYLSGSVSVTNQWTRRTFLPVFNIPTRIPRRLERDLLTISVTLVFWGGSRWKGEQRRGPREVTFAIGQPQASCNTTLGEQPLYPDWIIAPTRIYYVVRERRIFRSMPLWVTHRMSPSWIDLLEHQAPCRFHLPASTEKMHKNIELSKGPFFSGERAKSLCNLLTPSVSC